MYELTKEFGFEAAHTLVRAYETESSARVHGHSYRVRVSLGGEPDPRSGMIMDMAAIEAAISETRLRLDHHMLDEVPGLGPATLENLARWIWGVLKPRLPGLARVTVSRESIGDACSYWEP
jgi:6-pyruvoyltetrahydropterin/6-carboxytetrahydropterin synthase